MICTSLADKNPDTCIRSIEKVDMAEIRLDLTEFDEAAIGKVFSRGKKLIATCRPSTFTEDERQKKLATAIASGATYVDIEFESTVEYRNRLIEIAHDHQCEVIISYHNFKETPELAVLESILYRCYEMGADIAKIATMVNFNRDNSKILSLYKAPGRLVAIGMGDLGKISRIVAPFLGAEFTFASLNENESTAPGQISYQKLSQFILEIQQI